VLRPGTFHLWGNWTKQPQQIYSPTMATSDSRKEFLSRTSVISCISASRSSSRSSARLTAVECSCRNDVLAAASWRTCSLM
jgi:hypothetical protein